MTFRTAKPYLSAAKTYGFTARNVWFCKPREHLPQPTAAQAVAAGRKGRKANQQSLHHTTVNPYPKNMRNQRIIPIALAALLGSLGASAQEAATPLRTPAETRLAYPLLSQQMRLRPRAPQLPNASLLPKRLPLPSEAARAVKSAKFWCNLIYKQGWDDSTYGPYGYWTLTAQSPVSFDVLARTGDNVNVATNGVQAKDGHIYGAYLNMQYASEGYVYLYLSDTDLKTGQTATNEVGMDYLSLAATETAQAEDGTVYGVFYAADGQSLEWGVADYQSRTRTTIAPAKQAYVALGITKGGQLYGIAMDGWLYKINKATGEETKVGPTGHKLTNVMGQYYGQSGEIDQRDDTFYWYSIDADGQAGLYTVDLQTGATTLIDGTLAQVQGMVLAQPEAPDGAPATADNLLIGGQMYGDADGAKSNISFTIPNVTYDGDILRGTVHYKVECDHPGAIVWDDPAEGDAKPSQDINVNFTATENGFYTFTVVLSNDKGDSPKGTFTKWLGYDVPFAPTQVKAEVDGNRAVLTWVAPKTSVHAGPMETLTYDVRRITNDRDTTLVSTGNAATSFTDNLGGGQLRNYSYEVRAVSRGMKSDPAYSNAVVIGDAIEPDWQTDFPDRATFGIFSALDANHDGVTWTYFNAGGQQMALGPYNNDCGNDDWLFTPPFHLTTGRVYNVKVKARNYLAPDYVNTFEIKAGTAATAEGMTLQLMPTCEISGDPEAVYQYEINPEAEGNYFVGFHDNTQKAGEGRTVVDYFSIEKGPLFAAPDSVHNLTVTPAAKGGLSADLSFTAPTETVDGKKLSAIAYFVIKRDGKSVMWIGNGSTSTGEPGKQYSWTDDNVPAPGWHTYEVIAYHEDGVEPGRTATKRAYIGSDVTQAPDVTLFDNGSDIRATWPKFGSTGANGGYLDPDHVSMSIYELFVTPDGAAVGDELATSAQGATEVNVPWNPNETTADDAESQALYQVAARSNSDGGHSQVAVSRAIIVGEPIRQPYKETFEAGQIQNGFAWTESNEQHASRWNAAQWMLNGRAASNDDGGGLLWSPYTIPDPEFPEYYNIEAGDQTSFNLPKVALGGVDEPVLRFDLYAEYGEMTDITILVQTPDGKQHELKTFKLSERLSQGWTTETVDLSEFTEERYVIVKFLATAHANYAYVCIDEINIYDASDPESGIHDASKRTLKPARVTTLDGRTVRQGTTATDDLPRGIYIVGGQKRAVK